MRNRRQPHTNLQFYFHDSVVYNVARVTVNSKSASCQIHLDKRNQFTSLRSRVNRFDNQKLNHTAPGIVQHEFQTEHHEIIITLQNVIE
jgi:hypothetical protein